jgi:MFS family permease
MSAHTPIRAAATSSAYAAVPPVSGQAWYTVGVFMMCYTLSFIDRQILGTFVDPIKQDFGVTDAQVGMLQGLAFALFYTFIGLPLGRWVDKTNRRNLIAAGVLIWSFFTASCAFATSFDMLFISRMGVGIGEATLGPAAFSIMIDLFPRQRMGVAASVFYWGNLLGAGLALLVGGAVREAAATMAPWNIPFMGEVTGWRLVFVMLGIPGMLFALLVFTVKEPVRKAMAVGADGKVFHPSMAEVFAQIKLRWQSVLGISVAVVFQAGSNYAFMGWAVTHFLRTHHWGPGQTTRALGTLTITCGIAGLYAGGWLSDRLHRKGITDAPLLVAIPSAIGIMTFLTATMLAPTPEMALMFAAPGLFCLTLPMGTAGAAVPGLFPNQYRGFVTALYLFILNGGSLPIGNYIPGYINTNFFNEQQVGTASAITIGFCGVMMLILILATRSKYREHYAMIQH